MPLLTDIPNYFKKTFKGATAFSAGLIGLVPAPSIGQQNTVLRGDSTWASLSASDVSGLGTAAVEDSTAFAAPADIPDPSSATPQALGTAAAGSSDDYSRADHVHAAPAINDLSNVSAGAPSDNDVLVYDNATSTWVAEAPSGGGGASLMQSIAVGFVLN